MRLFEIESKTMLYHGTSILNAIRIINDNKLRDDLGEDDEGRGVSFSTDNEIAEIFAKQSEEFTSWSEDIPVSKFSGCVLQFSRKKLNQYTKLRRVQWDGVSTEKEIRSEGTIYNVKTFLTKINIDRKEYLEYKRICEEHDLLEPEDFIEFERIAKI